MVEGVRSQREFKLLAALLQNVGHALTRSQLLDLVRSEMFDGYERTIDVHIKTLRKKINRPGFIETVRGIGYRLCKDQKNETDTTANGSRQGRDQEPRNLAGTEQHPLDDQREAADSGRDTNEAFG